MDVPHPASVPSCVNDIPLEFYRACVKSTRRGHCRGAQAAPLFGRHPGKPAMLLVSTYVAPSAIEGVGVFAAEPIAAGTRIWRLEPSFDRLIKKAEVLELAPLMQAFVDRYAYPLLSDPDTLIVELDNGRFMNHNDVEPNTRFDDPDAGYALRDIEAGEELTCNYAEFDPAFEIMPGRHFLKNGGAGEARMASG
jgi:SET domain-containing protein